MELWKKSWLIFKRRWPILFIPVVLALAGVLAYDVFMPKNHTATTTLFLRAPDIKSSASAYQGNLFTVQRATTYVNMVKSDELAQMVVDKLGLSTSAHELAGKVKGAVVRDTVIIDISVTDRDAQQAANLANTYGSVFATYVAKVEAADLSADVPPLVTTVVAATAGDATSSILSLKLLLPLAGVPALLLGLLLVYLAERYDHRLRSRQQIEEVAEVPVIGRLSRDRALADSDSIAEAFENSQEFADEARALSINIEHILRSKNMLTGPVAVAVASVGKGDGKSIVAGALVKALEERGRSVGLLHVTLDGAAYDREGVRTEVLATAGNGQERQKRPDRTSAGTAEQDISAAINDMSRVKEFIIVDPAGSGAAPEAQIAASLSDAVVVVVRPGHTDENALADLVNGMSILGVPVIGAVANRAKETNTVGRFYA